MRFKMGLLAMLLIGVFAGAPALAPASTETKSERNHRDKKCYVVLSSSSSKLKVRSGPSSKYAVVLTIGHRATVTVVGADGDWRQIIYGRDGREYIGWVRAEYLWC